MIWRRTWAFLTRLWPLIRRWFDPDRRWFSLDKKEHFGGFFVLGLLLCIVGLTPVQVLVWGMIVGVAFEAGQADVAHSLDLLGEPGYGIGLLDLAWDLAGLIVALGWWISVGLLF